MARPDISRAGFGLRVLGGNRHEEAARPRRRNLPPCNSAAIALKGRRVTQFGELVIATRPIISRSKELAGALAAAAKADAPTREAWRRARATFFQGQARPGSGASRGGERRAVDGGGASPA